MSAFPSYGAFSVSAYVFQTNFPALVHCCRQWKSIAIMRRTWTHLRNSTAIFVTQESCDVQKTRSLRRCIRSTSRNVHTFSLFVSCWSLAAGTLFRGLESRDIVGDQSRLVSITYLHYDYRCVLKYICLFLPYHNWDGHLSSLYFIMLKWQLNVRTFQWHKYHRVCLWDALLSE